MDDEAKTKMVFAVAEDGTGDGIPLVVVGIPREAWVHIKDGKTNTFDLTKAGLPIKLMIFGGKNQEECMNVLKLANTTNMRDLRGVVDFSIDPKGKKTDD